MNNINRKLILSNFKYFNWWLSFKADVLKPLLFKTGYKDTALINKIRDISPEVKDYSIIFTNKCRRLNFYNGRDEVDYVKLNIDSMDESEILDQVEHRCTALWTNGIPYIAWLYKNYPTYNVPFSDLELKFIDNWLQSTLMLDEVVRFFNYSPYETKFDPTLANHFVRIQIVAKLFYNKYVFEALQFWWSRQDIRTLTVNFPFNITLLSMDAQLFFYLYHYMAPLSLDTKAILVSNMFDYPPYDEVEKTMLIEFQNGQRINMHDKLEYEIHKIYKEYRPFNVLREKDLVPYYQPNVESSE